LLLPEARARTSPSRIPLEVREGLLGEGDVEFSGIGGPIPDTSLSPEVPPDRENGVCVPKGSR